GLNSSEINSFIARLLLDILFIEDGYNIVKELKNEFEFKLYCDLRDKIDELSRIREKSQVYYNNAGSEMAKDLENQLQGLISANLKILDDIWHKDVWLKDILSYELYYIRNKLKQLEGRGYASAKEREVFYSSIGQSLRDFTKYIANQNYINIINIFIRLIEKASKAYNATDKEELITISRDLDSLQNQLHELIKGLNRPFEEELGEQINQVFADVASRLKDEIQRKLVLETPEDILSSSFGFLVDGN
ncbi:MAG TPA: hypothetical protein VHA52_12000, partial [Candidatus Babeliaceae bacterium]|nr:hypothetical protein [Candidatus Babeliaceae bacterium]